MKEEYGYICPTCGNIIQTVQFPCEYCGEDEKPVFPIKIEKEGENK
jgi:uncharacterized OB-fold protein